MRDLQTDEGCARFRSILILIRSITNRRKAVVVAQLRLTRRMLGYRQESESWVTAIVRSSFFFCLFPLPWAQELGVPLPDSVAIHNEGISLVGDFEADNELSESTE